MDRDASPKSVIDRLHTSGFILGVDQQNITGLEVSMDDSSVVSGSKADAIC